MKTEQILTFWSQHNATIIEVLIALILVSFIYLAFRTFFQEDSAPESGASAQFNTAEIEKTLQKLIESQNSQRVGFVEGATAAAGAAAEGLSSAAVAAAQSLAGSAQVEAVQKMTKQVQEKDQQVVELKKQIEILQATVNTAGVAGAMAAAAGATGAAAGANPDLEKKLKDLEARLAEYEIISEDIADLSFYKEENAKLQKELSAAKGVASATAQANAGAALDAAVANAVNLNPGESAPSAGAAAATAATGLKLGDSVNAIDVGATQVSGGQATTPGSGSTLVSGGDGSAAGGATTSVAGPDGSLIDSAVAKSKPESSAIDAAVTSGIDDELMKEFAAAVKDQKATGAPEAPGNVVIDDQKKLAENENLMGEFENFVKKG